MARAGLSEREIAERGQVWEGEGLLTPEEVAARLRDAALQLARGGVGYYPQSNFIHLDTGRVRSWG